MLLLLACAHRPDVPTAPGGEAPSLGVLRRDGVALAPVVYVADLPAPPLAAPPAVGNVEAELVDATLPPPTVLDPERDAAFLRGHYLGSVKFGGGTLLTGNVALETRARLMEFHEQDRYRTLGGAWLAESLATALDDLRVDVSAGPAVAPPLQALPVRGLQPDDGRDNVNLPRSTFRPSPLAPLGEASAPWLLVPYLRCYYSHNGGWFIGQQYGTMAGARVQAIVVLYDARTGQPAWWLDATGRFLDRATATASTAQLDQYVLWAEDDVEEIFARELFR